MRPRDPVQLGKLTGNIQTGQVATSRFLPISGKMSRPLPLGAKAA
jgi:hypothetical protein